MTRNALFVVALVGALALYWFTTGKPTRSPDVRPWFLGTWTDENGPPGNYLRLQLVPRSSGLPGLQLLEGKGKVQGLFGEANTAIIWNYESYEPLRLNVVIGTRTMVAPVRVLGADRMLIRWVPTADVDGWSGAKALDGPGAGVLTRAAVEPEAP